MAEFTSLLVPLLKSPLSLDYHFPLPSWHHHAEYQFWLPSSPGDNRRKKKIIPSGSVLPSNWSKFNCLLLLYSDSVQHHVEYTCNNWSYSSLQPGTRLAASISWRMQYPQDESKMRHHFVSPIRSVVASKSLCKSYPFPTDNVLNVM